jgi:hypothetical protein
VTRAAVLPIAPPVVLSSAAWVDAQALPAFVLDGRRYLGRVLGLEDLIAEIEPLMQLDERSAADETERLMLAIARKMFPSPPWWAPWRRDGWRALLSMPPEPRAELLGCLFFWYVQRLRRAQRRAGAR